jgi:hypothetical protein
METCTVKLKSHKEEFTFVCTGSWSVVPPDVLRICGTTHYWFIPIANVEWIKMTRTDGDGNGTPQ